MGEIRAVGAKGLLGPASGFCVIIKHLRHTAAVDAFKIVDMGNDGHGGLTLVMFPYQSLRHVASTGGPPAVLTGFLEPLTVRPGCRSTRATRRWRFRCPIPRPPACARSRGPRGQAERSPEGRPHPSRGQAPVSGHDEAANYPRRS